MSEQAATIPDRPTIADILIAHGFVDEEQLGAAIEVSNQTGQPVGQVLVNAGAITRLELASALAEQWSIPNDAIATTPYASPGATGLRVLRAPAVAGPAPAQADEAYLSRLHEAIADLARRVGTVEPLLAEVEQRATEAAAADTLDALEARLATFAEQLEASVAATAAVEGAVGATADDVEALTDSVEQAVKALQEHIGELVERFGAVASTADSAATRGDVEALRSELGALNDAFGDLRAAVVDIGYHADGDNDIQAKIGALEQLTAELGARPEFDVGIATRLDELAGQVESLAAIASSGDDRLDIDELSEALEELGRRRGADEEGAKATTAVAATVAQITERLQAGDASVRELAEQIETLSSRLDHDATTLAEVQALATATMQPVSDPELVGRLAALAAQVEELAAETRAEELRAPEGYLPEHILAAVELLRADVEGAVGAAMARIETLELTAVEAPAVPAETGEPAWTVETAGLGERLDVLASRLDDFATRLEEGTTVASGDRPGSPSASPRSPADSASTDDETQQELERLRMAIERMSLNLGQQERAIADVMRSRGVADRLDELEARIDDIAAVGGDHGGAGVESVAHDGVGVPAASNVEVRALVRRLDSAEAALEAERDKLLTKLERIASALDWRMRRLEAEDVVAPDG